ncbi:NEDD8-specific protease 1 [Camellia lanceoleosa]|uniref:NEDD8-specific protease 1 n=1 Tax=Camellia lanceoleosa TaxID=1840588 RepID=A0ACC0F5Q3_9ERIC|nr:NEDD8-specific protease 1 [Camellia lanceoleosa]
MISSPLCTAMWSSCQQRRCTSCRQRYLPSCYPSEEILLVSPSIAFWIANCPDIESLKDFVEPLNLSSNGYFSCQ